MSHRTLEQRKTSRFSWRVAVAPFERPSLSRAVRQILNSFIPYAALWILMILTIHTSIWITLLLAIPAAGFLSRIFIIFHDCGHGSFFKSKRANNLVGFASGVLTLTPYFYWRHRHAIHHATSGNLDRRGIGDFWTMTLREYRQASPWLRIRYRLARNPITMLLIGPAYMFLVFNRFAEFRESWRWHVSVLWSNLAILALAAGLSSLIGLQTYLLIQLPIILAAAMAGVWLFYVQHQFEGVYWGKQEEWDYVRAALEGCSYYKLPRLLQWFSGNIGFHHIHHLSPRIPNYHLESCHRHDPIFRQVRELTLWQSLRCLQLRVWDEERRALIGLGVF